MAVTTAESDSPPPSEEYQPTLDETNEPLSAATFCVVDLETTGASPRTSTITEIGAIKTRGGKVVGEFHTLVNPGTPIPPMIVSLTGITDTMVSAAPRIEQVLPTFLEFLGDAVLVAHHAPFDVGFLKAACRTHDYPWRGNQVVDTVTLARRATTKEEAPNKKLGTLARAFGTVVTPRHRALDDARATSEILHKMLERVAAWGITHRADLGALRNPMPENIRKKATMADSVPVGPGAYVFRGPRGEYLYVGTSKDLRSRVKSYFTTGEQRRHIRHMLKLAVRVDAHRAATELEANILELRLIATLRPRYNRRSTRPERTPWVRLTNEKYPRLSIVRSVTTHDTHLGPMPSATAARAAIDALQEATGLRRCTLRLSTTPRSGARACLLKDLGECSAPCIRGTESGYAHAAARVVEAIAGDPTTVVEVLASRIDGLADNLDYERAAGLRDGISALISGACEAKRLTALRRCTLVAARPAGGGWDIAAIAHGRLVATAHSQGRVLPVAANLREQARTESDLPQPDTLAEERLLVAQWLESPGVRLLHVEGEWAQPRAGAGRHLRWVNAARDDRTLASEISSR